MRLDARSIFFGPENSGVFVGNLRLGVSVAASSLVYAFGDFSYAGRYFATSAPTIRSPFREMAGEKDKHL